jgi:hypothetical protein
MTNQDVEGFFADLMDPNIIDNRHLGYDPEDLNQEPEPEEPKLDIPITPYERAMGKALLKEYKSLEKFDALPVISVPVDKGIVSARMRIYKWVFVVTNPRSSDLNMIMYSFYRKYKKFKKELDRGSRVQIVITYNKFNSVATKVIPQNITIKTLIELMSRNEHYDNAVLENMLIIVKEIKGRRGGCGIKDKRRCIYGFSSEGYCGLKCVIIGIIYHNIYEKNLEDEKTAKSYVKKILRNDDDLTKMAIDLGNEIQIKTLQLFKNEPTLEFPDFEHITCLPKYKHYQIVIFRTCADFKPFKTKNHINDPKKIYIGFENNHYLAISNVHGYVKKGGCKRVFCETCLITYDKRAKQNHKCSDFSCVCCNTEFETAEELKKHSTSDPKHCDKCNMFIRYGDECKKAHEKICNAEVIQCKICGTKYDTNDNHTCVSRKCMYCLKMVEPEHICFIESYKKTRNSKKYTAWAWDIESTIDPITHEHKPQIICAINLIGSLRLTWSGDKCMEEFVDWCLINSKLQTLKLYAHNGKAYDTYLVREFLVNVYGIKPSTVIMNGQKIMYMKVKKIQFLDSMNHFIGSLQSQIKTFGLTDDDGKTIESKGFFPYTFYTPQQANYVGELPDDKYFNIQDKNKWLEFKSEFKDCEYDIKKECIKYCLHDCEILRRALYEYRLQAVDLNNLDPLEFVTIASYAQKVFLMSHYCEEEFIQDKSPLALLPQCVDQFIQKSFKGGRTEVFKLKVDPELLTRGEKLRYIDVSSMYPAVQCYDLLPYGRPKEFLGRLKDLADDEIGFIDCIVHSPPIHLPLLMIHCPETNKLISPIGKFRGTFTSMELKKAIKLGYRITKHYNGYKFKARRGMFSSYINKYYKLKEEAKDNGNNGLAQVCKLMLNSLWGKFAQRSNLDKNVYINDPNKWFDIIEDDGKSVKQIESTKNGDLFVKWCWDDDSSWDHPQFGITRNIALASAVTSNARLRLYHAMEISGKNLCYVDTDSSIYHEAGTEISDLLNVKCMGGKEKLCLGDWELEKDLYDYVAVGPKSYAIRTKSWTPESKKGEIAKCKGFSTEWINFDMYVRMIEDPELSLGNEAKVSFDYPALQFKKIPSRGGGKIITNDITKRLAFLFNKRNIVWDGPQKYCTTPLRV